MTITELKYSNTNTYLIEGDKGTDIEKSWNNLLSRNPSRIYYGHAKTAIFAENDMPVETQKNDESSLEI